jgi:hypothetical protein
MCGDCCFHRFAERLHGLVGYRALDWLMST